VVLVLGAAVGAVGCPRFEKNQERNENYPLSPKNIMTPKAREYQAKAELCEQRAKAIRNREDREWQQCLARAYRLLAEAEETRSKLRPTPRERIFRG
jgi:hypothetical protein